MKLEGEKGANHYAAVTTAFIRDIQQHLPREAFEEISRLQSADIPQWADKWFVHAPCVLEYARSWCAGGWDPDWTSESRSGPSIPKRWFDELKRLNALSIDPSITHVLETFITDGERRARLGSLKSLPPNDPRRAAEPFLKKELPKRTSERLRQDVALKPIGADPFLESEQDFLKRARVHFQARVLRARDLGYSIVSVTPKLEDQMNWLIQYQLHGKRRELIAKESHVVRQAVDRAIRQLARVLDLRLRPSARSSG
jgi:hypothetical protein